MPKRRKKGALTSPLVYFWSFVAIIIFTVIFFFLFKFTAETRNANDVRTAVYDSYGTSLISSFVSKPISFEHPYDTSTGYGMSESKTYQMTMLDLIFMAADNEEWEPTLEGVAELYLPTLNFADYAYGTDIKANNWGLKIKKIEGTPSTGYSSDTLLDYGDTFSLTWSVFLKSEAGVLGVSSDYLYKNWEYLLDEGYDSSSEVKSFHEAFKNYVTDGHQIFKSYYFISPLGTKIEIVYYHLPAKYD